MAGGHESCCRRKDDLSTIEIVALHPIVQADIPARIPHEFEWKHYNDLDGNLMYV